MPSGGQPGHHRHARELVPPEQLAAIADCMPPACRGCGRPLHGEDSESGSRFAERMLTALATCRQRGRELLGFLAACMRARLDGTAAPSLLT